MTEDKKDYADSGVVFYLSISDLERLDDWDVSLSPNEIESLLLHNGMDIKNYTYELIRDTHRNLKNEIVTCARYIGAERTDKAFLRTGAASLQAVIASSKDASHRRDLRTMSKQSFQHVTVNDEEGDV